MNARLFALTLSLTIPLTLAGCQCGSPSSPGDGGAGATGGGGGGGGGDGGGGGGAGGGQGGGAASCVDGEPCAGGVCAGGACCAVASACGSACCGDGERCSFNQCVTPGVECREANDCGPGDFCDFSAGTPPDAGAPGPDAGVCAGGTGATGRCLPRPPLCPEVDGGHPGAGTSCIETCRFERTSTTFELDLKYAWGGDLTAPWPDDVMMAPIVTQLDDDDCDGRVTANDMPDIVFTTFPGSAYTLAGTLHAISVRDGQLVEKWSLPGRILANSQLASGNIDGQPGNEVVGCGAGEVVAVRADGTVLWATPAAACEFVYLVDLDGDGTVEVVTETQSFAGVDGALLVTRGGRASGFTVADLDGDGVMDIIGGGGAWRSDGTVLASTGLAATSAAIADLDGDGQPEVIGVDTTTHSLFVWRYTPGVAGDATVVRPAIDINGAIDPARCAEGSAGRTKGGGPPTVGDFNADGTPDVALAGGVGYAVLDGTKLMDPSVPGPSTFLWARETQDCSSAATGSSLFDFDGDGRAEAVYADEVALHVYDSATGADRVTVCNTSGTLKEYPLVVDVDNDGQADLVVASNAYSSNTCGGVRTAGIRVFSSRANDWVVTRRIWNQHAYSVTNVEEDGTIPRVQQANWRVGGLNNFRQQKQPGQEFAAADAVVSLDASCEGPPGVRVLVRNLGEAQLPPGVRVDVFAGAPPSGTLLGSASTTRTLGPAQSEALVLPLTDQSVINGLQTVYGTVTPLARECRADNNTSAPVYVGCMM